MVGSMDPGSLESVIRRAKLRDPAAFDALVDSYSPRLFGFLYRLTSNRSDAEDLLQDVFLRVVRRIEHYDHRGQFDAWLFRIATNLVRDRARRASRSPRLTSLEGRGEHGSFAASDGRSPQRWADSSAPPPDGSMVLGEQVDALQLALAKLPEVEREVIMLRHFGRMSFAEIAEIMGTPLGTALARGHRALKRLRKLRKESS